MKHFDKRLLPQLAISGAFIAGFFIVLIILASTGTIELTDRVFGLVKDMLMVLSTGVMMVLQFWVGSSSGSKEKDSKPQEKEPEQRG